MLTLKNEKCRYLRVRKGMDGEVISSRLNCPVPQVLKEGQIIRIYHNCRYVSARVGDSYGAIARREGVDEGQLLRLNGECPVYPTRRIWLPPD